ncbi:hypothetical protein F0562_018303 [Nyssa sinensis]|uniref:Uncharacterized protein n=1 Tax=Nyssa sinensis TaxID=561372 RepID=A0A5J4ZBN7_9ASTE|nr:hypothetical protein F0562_018303 [Nyssa sinensis]
MMNPKLIAISGKVSCTSAEVRGLDLTSNCYSCYDREEDKKSGAIDARYWWEQDAATTVYVIESTLAGVMGSATRTTGDTRNGPANAPGLGGDRECVFVLKNPIKGRRIGKEDEAKASGLASGLVVHDHSLWVGRCGCWILNVTGGLMVFCQIGSCDSDGGRQRRREQQWWPESAACDGGSGPTKTKFWSQHGHISFRVVNGSCEHDTRRSGPMSDMETGIGLMAWGVDLSWVNIVDLINFHLAD